MYLGFYFIFFTANHSYISVLQMWRRSPAVTIASAGATFISSLSATIAVITHGGPAKCYMMAVSYPPSQLSVIYKAFLMPA